MIKFDYKSSTLIGKCESVIKCGKGWLIEMLRILEIQANISVNGARRIVVFGANLNNG